MTLEQSVGVVAAGPGQFGPVASLTAEGQRVLKVVSGLVQVTHGLGQEAEDAVGRYDGQYHRASLP